MPYPSLLANARLRATFIDAGGNPDPAVLQIRAAQTNAVGETIITTSTYQAEAPGGKLDTPVPVGTDTDLSRPLVLDIEARYGGAPTPTRPRRPERYLVQVTEADVETVTESGQSVKIVNLAKLIRIDGVPLVTLGMVKSVDGIKPDGNGNVDLPDFLLASTLTNALKDYAQKTALESLARQVDDLPTAGEVQNAINGYVTDALGDYVRSNALAPAIREAVLSMLAAGSGIGFAYDSGQNRLTISNTAQGTGGGGTGGGSGGGIATDTDGTPYYTQDGSGTSSVATDTDGTPYYT